MRKLRKTLHFLLDILRAGLNRIRGTGGAHAIGKERDPEWYDLSFRIFRHWKKHYTRSRYYFLWSVVAERLLAHGCHCILDIGCGPGQFACLLRDRGIKQYHGLDFSEQRIVQARSVCPEYEFYMEDAYETDKFNAIDYDSVVMMEVLEHVEEDLKLIRRIRTGTRLLATVPNFSSAGHVRFFNTEDEVRSRYENLLSHMSVASLRGDQHGKIYYLIDAVV